MHTHAYTRVKVVVEHDHMQDKDHTMWKECLHARKALTEVYNMEPIYNTHSHYLQTHMTLQKMNHYLYIRMYRVM